MAFVALAALLTNGTQVHAQPDRPPTPRMVYEVEQRLERDPAAGGFSLKAVNPGPLIADFAAVTAFVLDVTCTPDADLARRLTQTAASGPGGARRRPTPAGARGPPRSCLTCPS